MRTIVAAAILTAVLHASVWFLNHHVAIAPEGEGSFQSLSFAPYDKSQDPNNGDVPTIEQISNDLAHIAPYTRAIRTYTTTGGLELIPTLARRYGLSVAIGAWVDTNEERSQREIENAIEISRTNPNVRSVLVGNEMLYRSEKDVEDVVKLIQYVKKRVKVPVSTGEIWSEWLKYPQLVNAADFIAVHILPFWEGVPAQEAVAFALNRLDDLHRAYPGKRIVVAEFGWPSNGANKFGAKADSVLQGQIIRQFLVEARRKGIEYNIVEAFDQPWKNFEGHGVGPYWGIFNADRQFKFSLIGVVEDAADFYIATSSIVVGLLFSILGLRHHNITFIHAFAYSVASNILSVEVVIALAYPFFHYMNGGTWFMWSFGCLTLVLLVLVGLVKVYEIAQTLFGHSPLRLLTSTDTSSNLAQYLPKVSIHIPAYHESPSMLKTSLDAVATLDYPNFEVLVILNNSPEEKYWKPVAEHCMRLGQKFKFVYLPKVSGYKAGAMNAALPFMGKDSEIIAVIDADYVVHSSWLRNLVPYFDNPCVAFIQAPQDHHDNRTTLLRRMMKWEYNGFFDIGMVYRNEGNAIIAHGTMLLLRRSAFEQVQGWSTDTIVEDSELGLRLFEAGYIAHYTNTRYGWGILPDTYGAFKIQRHRWAYGAVQIFRKHYLYMMPGVSILSNVQKIYYMTGWVYWLSDAIGTFLAISNLLWVPVVIFIGLAIPPALTIPLIIVFCVNILHNIFLYRCCVKTNVANTIGAAVAAMSLQFTVAKAVCEGFIKNNLPFKRTEKGGSFSAQVIRKNIEVESIIGFSLFIAACLVKFLNREQELNLNLFSVTLFIQAIPFLSTVIMRSLEKKTSFLLSEKKQTTHFTTAYPLKRKLKESLIS